MTFSVEGFFLGYLLVSIGTFYFVQALLSLGTLFTWRERHDPPSDLMYRIPIVMGGGGPGPMPQQQPAPPLSAQAGAEPGQYL